eukprot:1159902-Pelagomonas_calceolata.AAC.2
MVETTHARGAIFTNAGCAHEGHSTVLTTIAIKATQITLADAGRAPAGQACLNWKPLIEHPPAAVGPGA